MPSNNNKNMHRHLKIRLSDIKKVATLNIGTILFSALFIYMVISILMYLVSDHITSYQVTSGPLSRNQTYTALAVRQEQLVTANTGGAVTYYTRESSRIKKQGAVYGVGAGQINDAVLSDLTESQLAELRASMAKFAGSFDSNNFYDTYSFKYEIEGSLITEYLNTSSGDSEGAQVQTVGGQAVNFAPTDGIVQFSKDGYENVGEEEITKDLFNQKSYQKINLRKDSIATGDDAYKLITSEEWYLLIPLTDAQVVSLEGRDSIRVCFLKDHITQTGDFTIITSDDGYYGKVTFSDGMLRYASDRFLQVELVTNSTTGLKVPISSIVNKEFYVIPEAYYKDITEDSDEVGFEIYKRKKSRDDENSSNYINATVYAIQDGYYYVDETSFSKGDVIVKPGSTDHYTIRETKPLEGVYCINKGYAVFRKVVIVDQNEEFCIVESGTKYGISQFDNIVYDSSMVEEEEVLY